MPPVMAGATDTPGIDPRAELEIYLSGGASGIEVLGSMLIAEIPLPPTVLSLLGAFGLRTKYCVIAQQGRRRTGTHHRIVGPWQASS